jgi:nucleoid DNA-binding protein
MADLIARIAVDAHITKVQAKAALESLVAQVYKGAISKDGFRSPASAN